MAAVLHDCSFILRFWQAHIFGATAVCNCGLAYCLICVSPSFANNCQPLGSILLSRHTCRVLQFLLYCRQCRYYPLSMLLTLLLIWIFLRMKSARHCALFA